MTDDPVVGDSEESAARFNPTSSVPSTLEPRLVPPHCRFVRHHAKEPVPALHPSRVYFAATITYGNTINVLALGGGQKDPTPEHAEFFADDRSRTALDRQWRSTAKLMSNPMRATPCATWNKPSINQPPSWKKIPQVWSWRNLGW